MQSEKEKCRLGLLYDANNDPELIAERLAIKQKCHVYNHLSPLLTDERTATLREILGTTGESFIIEQPFYCDYGYNIHIGENFFANFNLVILDEAPVTFGDNTTIGAGSVVTRDIPSNVVAAGNPCRVLHPLPTTTE